MKCLVALGLLATVCCGGPRAFIDVTVASELTIPDEADAIDLTLLATGSDTPIEAQTFALDPARPFPIHIVLQPENDAPHDIRIHVVATLAGAPVADGGIQHTWQDDRVNEVTVPLTELR